MKPLSDDTSASLKVFNNWEIVAKGWYIACPSRSLSEGQVRSIRLCGQQIVVFRGDDGRVRALDAYCPHMGTDLGIGHVDGNWIRCFFHHWAFDEAGICRDIPCQSTIPSRANSRGYATDEKYGFVWVYPDIDASEQVAEFDELRGEDVVAIADTPLERNCHHHICMMNGIDVQHLKTVHKLNVEMDIDLQHHASGTLIDFTLSGQLPNTTIRDKIARMVLGDRYSYSMRYAHGCLGLLTLMKNVKLIPPLHMLYAYVPLDEQRTRIQPIYVARRRNGLLGRLITYGLLHLTRLFYYLLRDEDGLIYDTIRFVPNALLSIDQPVVEYMNYVNQLDRSIWSAR
ncbi:MAG TPA: Rieske 2Fe-2S domain-containing protein [Elainellaceae cyanobacterium]